ncbi:MAG TPA: DegT/DnrJ/EryC1/StrS family aminotransferase [Cyclobacteriaceae bacterium]|nr:DegT/DnrJ/EryC1/StrS family aminotransferase [Cyclobacteriaceae bacterium]
MIPFVNLRLQYESIQSEIDQAIQDVFAKSQFIGGDVVKKFEEEFSTLLGTKHCIGTGNGTDSLFLILKALGIGPGDEVITPAFSCIPSAECITLAEATVVFADVDDQYYTLDPADVERKITSRTKAVIAVHLYGQAAFVAQLKKLCDKHKIFLIEDCAQAHLSKEKNGFTGTFGVASAFSFYPTKNLGAYGDAGCVLTQDKIVAENVRRLANHGALKKNDHEIEGTNSRLDTLQAAILSVKLKHLKKWNDQRIVIADQYTNSLKNISGLTVPAVAAETEHTFHIYAIRTAKRDALKTHLSKAGIETLIHYPQALPFTAAYRYKNHSPGDFPVSAKLQHEVLSLPVYPGLTSDRVTTVIENIKRYF